MKVSPPADASRGDHQFTTGDGVQISFQRWGEAAADPVILHHGFMSSAEINWEVTRVVEALTASRHRVVALDARGHGKSDKPLEPEAYSLARMAADVVELADHLGVDTFDLVGYSMGALVAALVAADDPRVRRLVLGGIGRSAVERDSEDALDLVTIAEALEAGDASSIESPVPASFRAFADSIGADLAPLAAAARGHAGDVAPFERIPVPTLVLVGADDQIARHPATLVARIPQAVLETVPGDHLRAVGHPAFRSALAAFLSPT